MMSTQIITVVIPPGCFQGAQFMVKAPSGQSVVVAVPFGMGPGMIMHVKVPVPPPMPMVMGTKVDESAPSTSTEEKKDKPKVVEAAAPTGVMRGGVNPADLSAFMACCCIVDSCYCVWPKCLGCYSKGEIMCCKVELLYCKTGVDEGSLCLCMKDDCTCIKPAVCCKMTQQLFCLDNRCAFPCDSEVPCMFTVCCFTMCKDWKCAPKCAAKLMEAPPADDSQKL